MGMVSSVLRSSNSALLAIWIIYRDITTCWSASMLCQGICQFLVMILLLIRFSVKFSSFGNLNQTMYKDTTQLNMVINSTWKLIFELDYRYACNILPLLFPQHAQYNYKTSCWKESYGYNWSLNTHQKS